MNNGMLPDWGVRPSRIATQATEGKVEAGKMYVKCKCFKIICICYYKQEEASSKGGVKMKYVGHYKNNV